MAGANTRTSAAVVAVSSPAESGLSDLGRNFRRVGLSGRDLLVLSSIETPESVIVDVEAIAGSCFVVRTTGLVNERGTTTGGRIYEGLGCLIRCGTFAE